ncbi:MAG: diaminopimelate decarboxylase [Thermodesulfovibrionales bacterium]
MHYFNYKKGELFAEDVHIKKLAREYGTPLFVYSYKTLKRHFLAYDKAFNRVPHIICFAAKANSNAAILRTFAGLGGGADIVSGGELYRALKAGVDPKKIVYAGVGKTEDEIMFALRKGVLMFNVESDEELVEINRVAGKMKKRAPIALRVNPDIDPGTHPYIATGMKKHKFGIPIDDALEFYMLAKKLKNIEIAGVHKHIGSQITEVDPFVDALNRIVELVERLKENGINIRYLDIGGGLGIRYDDEEPPMPSDLASKIIPALSGLDVTVVLEPGRSLVGNAGIFVTKVLYTKKGEGREFVIVDGGMNDLIRPTLYSAYHDILPVKKSKKKKITADIVGPVCESGDFLGKGRTIPAPDHGDLLAVMSAGAYGFTMSSNYNSRPRSAEVMVEGKKHYLIKKRETLNDLVRGEKIPDILK